MVLPLIAAAAEEAAVAGTEAAAGAAYETAGAADAFAEAAVQMHAESLANKVTSVVNQLNTVTNRQGTIAAQMGTTIAQQNSLQQLGLGPAQMTAQGGGGAGQGGTSNLFQQASDLFGQKKASGLKGLLGTADELWQNAFRPGDPYIAKTEAATHSQQMTALSDVGLGSTFRDWERRFGNWLVGGATQNGSKPSS